MVVFAQGPIGLCATAGAKLLGATLIVPIDGDENRLAMAKRMGADVVLDYRDVDVGAEVQRLTGGGADVAIEALGTQRTFERSPHFRPGGTLSGLGVYSGKLQIPYEAFAAGLRRSPHSDDTLPRWQGAHAPADGGCQKRSRGYLPLLTHTFPLEKIARTPTSYSEN